MGWGEASSDTGPVLSLAKSLEARDSNQEEEMRKSCRWAGLRTWTLAIGLEDSCTVAGLIP